MSIKTGGVHHIALTVSDVVRARDFYHRILGMDIMMDNAENGFAAFTNGALLLSTHLPPDPSHTPANDHFSEHRMGLDHLSLSVDSRADLEAAIKLFDENDVPHGDIKDLSGGGFPILVLAFRDPDNIQLELTAPAE